MHHSKPGKITLLYVEDDAATRAMITRLLAKNGFDCLVAKNGCEGLDLFRKYSPQIVLSDIMMPEQSGLDMARAIRKDAPEAQFIFMTALGESKHILEAIDIGVTAYVVKPVELTKLLSVLAQCVATVRLKADAQRSKHLEAIGILAGGLAHDFNNLFQIMLGEVYLAKKHLDSGSPAYTFLQKAENVAGKARALGKQLGTLARGESGLKRKTPLMPIILDSVQAALSGSSSTASFELPPHLPQLTLDKTQMEQVFSHLTLNAIDAMPGGGTLEISARVSTLSAGSAGVLAPGDYVRISFKDSGPGIPAQHRPRIFDPYFTTKDMDFHKGRGLGLSVCHAIVSRHGGLIRAEDTSATGATFTIWLPVD
jgi:signal transduction histidine kinase